MKGQGLSFFAEGPAHSVGTGITPMPLLCGGWPVASFMNSAGHRAGDGQIERPDPKVH